MPIALKITLVFSLFAANLVQAQICEISVHKDSNGIARIYKIDFPDARRITLVAHRHGDRGAMWNLSQMPKSPEMFENIRKLIQKRSTQTALMYFREDLKVLRQAFKDGAQFAGMETSIQDAPVLKAHVVGLRDRMLKHSAETGESDIALISTATLAVYGAPVALSIQEPGLFKRASLTGFEDASAGLAAHALMPELIQLENVVREAFANDRETHRKWDQAGDDFALVTYQTYRPNEPALDAKIIKDYVAKFPPRYSKVMSEFMTHRLRAAKADYQRGELSALNILLMNKSGILFSGAMHTVPVMQRLRAACLEMPRAVAAPLNLVPHTRR